MVLWRILPVFLVATLLRFWMVVYGVPLDDTYATLMIIVTLLGLLLFSNGTSSEFYFARNLGNRASSIVSAWLILILILLVLGYATKISAHLSRRVLFTWFISTPPVLILAEAALTWYLSRLLLSGKRARRAVVAGGDAIGRALTEKIVGTKEIGLVVDGIFDDRSSDRLGESGSTPIIGKLSSLPDYVRNQNIDVIFFALPIRRVDRVTQILDELQDTTASIYFVPDVFVYELIQCRSVDIGGIPAVALCESPLYGYRELTKRLSDIVIASLVLLIVSPLLLAIAAIIKLSTTGSVIFKQRRYGLDGQEIIVYKFRTMNVSEDGLTVRQATRGDPRVTTVGAFLRRNSLDELPQFVNVLQGRMSVVGPRPHAIAQNEDYRKLIKGYMVRHKVKPGITGLAQIAGLRGETRTVGQMRERIEADLNYLRNWSLGLDFRIIAKTLVYVLTEKRAY